MNRVNLKKNTVKVHLHWVLNAFHGSVGSPVASLQL